MPRKSFSAFFEARDAAQFALHAARQPVPPRGKGTSQRSVPERNDGSFQRELVAFLDVLQFLTDGEKPADAAVVGQLKDLALSPASPFRHKKPAGDGLHERRFLFQPRLQEYGKNDRQHHERQRKTGLARVPALFRKQHFRAERADGKEERQP